MASYRTRAIVLRKTKLGEADLILTMIAESGIQLRCVAKGARKPKGRFSGRFELFCEVDIVVYEGKSLGTITDVTVVSTNDACRRDMHRLAYASVVAQFAEKSTFEGQENAFLFQLTRAGLHSIGDVELAYAPFIVAAYLIKASAYMGLRPSFDDCISCGTPREKGHRGTFSIEQGGWLCDDCSADESARKPADDPDAMVVQWTKALLGLRFAEIPEQEGLAGEGSSYLAGALLSFCERWLQAHLGLRLKTMDYLSSLMK